MAYLRVVGRKPLRGAYCVPAAKNAVLPILAASTLIRGKVTLVGCPRLADVDAMLTILADLGASTSQTGDVIEVDCTGVDKTACVSPLTGCMRSSLFLLGSMAGRMGEVSLGTVGGCVIGARPVDIHVEGLRRLGAEVEEKEDRLYVRRREGGASTYRLPFPSVGATVNLACYALSKRDTTILDNVAVEPEVVDLVNFLRAAGADVSICGRRLLIEGGKPLCGLTYRPIGDRIVAATVLIATAMTGGEVTVTGVSYEPLSALLYKLKNSSCIARVSCDTIHLCAKERPRSFSLTTGVYPDFATDMQSLALAYDATARGVALVRERVFENRFALAAELGKMGADISVFGDTARVVGRRLHGADTSCCDLRAGAALVCAALAADGISTINHIGLIERGYQHIERTFAALGADITSIDER